MKVFSRKFYLEDPPFSYPQGNIICYDVSKGEEFLLNIPSSRKVYYSWGGDWEEIIPDDALLELLSEKNGVIMSRKHYEKA